MTGSFPPWEGVGVCGVGWGVGGVTVGDTGTTSKVTFVSSDGATRTAADAVARVPFATSVGGTMITRPAVAAINHLAALLSTRRPFLRKPEP
ncbi:hypothetical protein ACQPZK_29550 [Micromonospora sp. CA-249363]|uniref:hypothetical protein n=1 Tax=Micromonospora sp. CA-249363 TaxID=3239963 RepID=UPI003D92B021